MEDMDQSPLVSSSSDSPPGPQPPFKYQFVREPEDEEEEEEEEDEEDEDEDLEELEVLERKPATGLSAAPVPTAPVAGAPLLDFGSDFVPPAPRGPLPAAPPAAPERPQSWDASPASPAVPAPSLPSAAAASPSKLPEDDEPPARPPPPPPASVSPQAEPAWTPPAPAPAAPPSTPAAPKRRGSSGSVAASFKEHEYLGNLPVLATEGTLQETSTEASKEFTEKAKNPFVDRDLTEFSHLEYSEMRLSFSGSPKAESAITVASPREENKDEQEDLVSNDILRNPQELPIALTNKSVKEEDKVMSPEQTKDSFSEKGIAAEAPMREEYADFKPFEQVWDVKDTHKQDSDVLAAGAAENLSTNIFPLLEDHTSENKTDEKKIEEKKAQIVTEKNFSTKTSNPFLVATQDSEADYVTTDNLSKTSEAMQESLYPVAAQLCPSFEESEATPSPVLPDIVMEAPLNAVVPGAGASAVQPSSPQLEAPPSVNYESIKLEPENPPPYEEAMNETKLSTEPSSDFSDYSEIAKVAQSVADHSELVEDSSPDSEPVDLFSDDSIPEVPQKQDEAVILPNLDTTRDTLSPDEVSTLTQKEKIPWQMKELNTAVYSDDGLFIAKEAKNVQPKDEDKVHVPDELSKDRSDISKVPLLPPDVSALAIQTEIGSIVKPTVLVKEAEKKTPSDTERENRSPSAIFSAELSKTSVVDLLYWRDMKKTGVVFGASLFLLLSLTVFSIVSVTAYIVLALLSVTISFRIYKGVIQAIQKSDEGHPFRAYLESEVAISEELVQKYSNSALGHVNCTIKELRRLFLVDDLVDSLKFAVLMWVFTYVGALFNGLTLLILALISLFSVPVIYERHQAQIDHYLGLANKNVKDAMAKIQAKIPGLKRKAE
ncbi:hypothetical protein GH733_009296 [Mirounga leonina]|nr:hypothetical protein GH733_009296 [Mirounga leonina]